MIKTVVVDENINSRELIKKYIEQNTETELLEGLEDFSRVNFENCDLVIFDINSKNKPLALDFIQKAKKRNIKLIALSYEMASSIVTEVLDAGADDFIIKPVLENILKTSIKKIFLSNEEKNISLSNAIAFFSSKGGTGKTSAVVNIGYNIAKNENKKVCILDLSFSDENAACYLNLKNTDLNFAISLLKDSKKETIYELLPKYENSNLYVLSFNQEFGLSSKLNQNQVSNLINSLKNVFDYVLIDTTSILNETIIPILNCADIIVYCTTLNLASIQSSLKHFEMFLKTGYNKSRIKLLINRYTQDLNEQLKDLEEKLNKIADCKIPNNYLTVTDAIFQAKPLETTNPNSNVAKVYKEFAHAIAKIEITDNLNDKCTIFSLLKRMGE